MHMLARRLKATVAVGIAGIGLTCVGLAVASPAAALDWLHDQRVESGRVCMSDHFHSGESSGQPTRQAAERGAAGSWSSFTSLEYGPEWGNFNLAGSKSIKCSGSGNSWSCSVEARPCRPHGAGPAPKRKR